MKPRLLLLNLWLFTSISTAQDNFIIGTWKYEKIPDHIEIDKEGLEMADQFFKDMTISFDTTNYTQVVMGKSENGTWSFLEKGRY